MTLLPEERKQVIMDELLRNGKIQVINLAKQLVVTPETIRRDLDDLEQQRLLKRVYGGAIPYSYAKREPHFEKKQAIQQEAKALIGGIAARLLCDGDTIVLDVGTTTLEMARAIKGISQLTIVTNSLPAASLLNDLLEAKVFDGQVIMLGGVTHPAQKSVAGTFTCEQLSRFRFDKAFLSCGGIALDGFTDYDMEETLCSAMMAKRAEQVYMLADETKLGQTQFFRICGWEEVTAVICDQPMPDEWRTSSLSINWMHP
ncbi:DeoR/GlpR family DNA-binding transcription regulator [Brevibacillus ruminantium]|uniref:DeoR/GlpR family DNA-binding transcription regulator n=1 Tax=Brevibacillus ruminantium TaxID=2950604 RepID=A0ABY4WAN7_9BACL|nr:DeoR/GlpR family DNA-binding transcription regulator [Brevibacillus ruminantium]USG64228.1 DeoR/GlpR family DNA-binding transcription regulator [Brevibacillus ruminantium]